MVSLQAQNTFWSYYPEIEETQEYQKDQYIKKQYQSAPFYRDIYRITQKEIDYDPITFPFSNEFTNAYQRFSKRFKRFDHYTLFIPIETSMEMTNAILLNHMVPFKIQPFQIVDHDVRIETLNGHFFYQKGYFNKNPTNQIIRYQIMDHASLFFITTQIN
jgi:hypothetical protein